MMDIGWAAIPCWLVNTSVAALLGLIGWGVYELLLR
jgi:hypothetical protein